MSEQCPANKELPGVACDAQRFYKDDVQRIKNLSANAYRFSTSWSLVQPDGPDSWDESVLNYYIDLCDELVTNGIRPVITLHHYDDPAWFFDHCQGFESEEGIQAYVRYCEKIYTTLMDHGVHLFFTFNAPEAYALHGYMEGTRPPGYKDRSPFGMKRAVAVTNQLLEAHKRTYHAIHALYEQHKKVNPNLRNPRVGVLKNIYQIDPWVYEVGPISFSSPLDKLLAWLANSLQDRAFYAFFAAHTDCLDFIGLNYYSHGIMKNFKPRPDASELPTNNPQYTVSAEGIHRALHTLYDNIAKPLGIPMYVTENGVAAGDDDQLRATFLKRYLYAITKAIEDGIPVLGYFYWSLMDNYEWGVYSKCYGLYKVDRSLDNNGQPKLTRTLRAGAQPFIDAATGYRHGYEQHIKIDMQPYWVSAQ
jgi:beta-glucosidase